MQSDNDEDSGLRALSDHPAFAHLLSQPFGVGWKTPAQKETLLRNQIDLLHKFTTPQMRAAVPEIFQRFTDAVRDTRLAAELCESLSSFSHHVVSLSFDEPLLLTLAHMSLNIEPGKIASLGQEGFDRIKLIYAEVFSIALREITEQQEDRGRLIDAVRQSFRERDLNDQVTADFRLGFLLMRKDSIRRTADMLIQLAWLAIVCEIMFFAGLIDSQGTSLTRSAVVSAGKDFVRSTAVGVVGAGLFDKLAKFLHAAFNPLTIIGGTAADIEKIGAYVNAYQDALSDWLQFAGGLVQSCVSFLEAWDVASTAPTT